VAARYGGDSCMPWALPGAPPSDGVPGSAAGELNVTFGVDSNQDVLETALDISRRFDKCSQRRRRRGSRRVSCRAERVPGLEDRGADPRERPRRAQADWPQGLLQGPDGARQRLSCDLKLRAPELRLAPRATPDELKTAAKLKRDEPEALAAAKLKRDEPERLAAAKLKRAEPDPPDFARFWAAYKLTRNQPK